MGDESDPARLYDLTAARTSRVVLAAYSTSFGLGARLLDTPTRDGIDAVYGLVRIADEVVDTRRGDGAADLLDELEAETARARARGWSPSVVVRSVARAARRGGVGPLVGRGARRGPPPAPTPRSPRPRTAATTRRGTRTTTRVTPPRVTAPPGTRATARPGT